MKYLKFKIGINTKFAASVLLLHSVVFGVWFRNKAGGVLQKKQLPFTKRALA